MKSVKFSYNQDTRIAIFCIGLHKKPEIIFAVTCESIDIAETIKRAFISAGKSAYEHYADEFKAKLRQFTEELCETKP